MNISLISSKFLVPTLQKILSFLDSSAVKAFFSSPLYQAVLCSTSLPQEIKFLNKLPSLAPHLYQIPRNYQMFSFHLAEKSQESLHVNFDLVRDKSCAEFVNLTHKIVS